jgi:hypothetical protein
MIVGWDPFPNPGTPTRNVPIAVEIGEAGVDRVRRLGFEVAIANQGRGDRRHDEAYGSTPAVMSPLALGLLHLSDPTLAARVSTSGSCHEPT